MPWVVPAHQAPALVLKTWWPRAFSGLALCLGAAVPDLEFIWRITPDWPLGHSWLAQFYATAPLTVALHALVTWLVLPWIVPLVAPGPPLHIDALRAIRPARSALDWLRVAWSGSIGGVTHVFLDGFTHGNHSGWAVPHLPWLRTPISLPGGSLALYDLLQIVLTILLGAAALQGWRGLATSGRLWTWRGESRPPAVTGADRWTRRGAWTLILVSLVTGVWVGVHTPPGPALELGAYGGLAFVSAAAVAMAALDRVRPFVAARLTWYRPRWADEPAR